MMAQQQTEKYIELREVDQHIFWFITLGTTQQQLGLTQSQMLR